MPLKIFIVEDSPLIRENLIGTLKELVNGDVIGIADTESDACNWLNDNKSDWELAVVDMFLLKGSGMGVVASCSARADNQKVVVLTNYATDHVRQKCIELGANAVFDKSNELDEFFDYAMSHHAKVRKNANRMSP